MKKKIIIILVGVFLIVSLGIYFIVIKSHVKINNLKDITLTIKEDTLTNEKVTLILTNNSDKNISYGNPYQLEIKRIDGWHRIIKNPAFTLEAYRVYPKGSTEIEVNLKNIYGKLKKGTYRIIKKIRYEDEEKSFNLAVEFKVK